MIDTTIKKTYAELKNYQPKPENCFFAFSNEQLLEGLKKHNLKKEDVFNFGHGLVGTKEGVTKFFDEIDYNTQLIILTIEPQEVYDYEFINHECDYTGDDSEAYEIVENYFGKEIAKSVKRKYLFQYTIEKL